MISEFRTNTSAPTLLTRRAWMAATCLAATGAVAQTSRAPGGGDTRFQRVATQFIAALGDPVARSGDGAQAWGHWPLDPGPRGVGLGSYGRLKDAGGIAPAGWKFDASDWWLEEHGLIMEQPDFPLVAQKYVVTGDRDVVTVLTVFPPGTNGNTRWELANAATLHDVTHLGCRAARYGPAPGDQACSPAAVRKAAFPVAPGAEMPAVNGCKKQDYAVLFIIGVAVGG